MSAPVWVFGTRRYKTIAGLYNMLSRDSGAEWVSAVGSDRIIKAGNGRNADQVIVARYRVSAPEVGKPMFVERVS